MPVNIDTLTSDVQVESRGSGGAEASRSQAPQPDRTEILRWRLTADAVSRDLLRRRATDQDD